MNFNWLSSYKITSLCLSSICVAAHKFRSQGAISFFDVRAPQWLGLLAFLVAYVPFLASAAPAGVPFELVSFSEDEIFDNKKHALAISETASDCLDRVYADHLAFFKKYGVSKYFGNRRKDYATKELRKKALKAYGKSEKLADLQESTSCVGLAKKCLAEGFGAVGMHSTWQKISDAMAKRQDLGTDLQQHLQALGWKIYYWNPDPSQNEVWDKEDRKLTPLEPNRKWMPVWGGHAARYKSVVQSDNYFGIKVDDPKLLVSFGTTQPSEFTKVPFFVGTAHAGYHVFPGGRGQVIEAHSKRDMNSIDNLEASEFNPLAPKGGPRWTKTEKYRSGIIVAPF